jgi:2'-5' RNA ligase
MNNIMDSYERFVMSGTIRTFLAFDIEDQKTLQRISHAQKRISNSGANLKIVKPQNIHVTIRFLGDIQPSMVDAIHEEMKQISFSSFTIELEGLGAFPKPSYPRVVWAGIKKGAEELKDVFQQLEPCLRGLGFKADNKGFNPHLTIARVRGGRNKFRLAEVIQEMVNYDFGTIKAECLRLKKSNLTPRGPIYTNIREVCAKT